MSVFAILDRESVDVKIGEEFKFVIRRTCFSVSLYAETFRTHSRPFRVRGNKK